MNRPTTRTLVLLLLLLLLLVVTQVVLEAGYRHFAIAPATALGTAGALTYSYPKYDVLLAFGDSITQFGFYPANSGYLIHLAQHFHRRMDVVNRGFSGYNTADARRIADLVLPQTQQKAPGTNPGLRRRLLPGSRPHRPTALATTGASGKLWPQGRGNTFPTQEGKLQLCILFFGANDARLEGERHHLPVEQYGDNLRYLASLLRDPDSAHYSPDTRILIVTPPAVGDRMIERTTAPGAQAPIRNSVTGTYAGMAMAVARELGIPHVDLYSAINDAAKTAAAQDPHGRLEGYDRYLVDGLHLSSGGNKLLYDLIIKTIAANWPEMAP
ncbi:isoamyl acetate-hydrolyzing esterase [Coemansia nantahalensis]|uniref:Isoamyl acetate-hydrolyzing esterase n=1 Tax=Coemansia nantahalensis TaxID=2789366 RepID=A0ACC1K412_9FUNG|nr:isoamyl acetate-hydrolyzing esterase [Coemansia nantahalensis]